MNNDETIGVIGLSIQIALVALAITIFSKYKSKIDEDSSFIKFPPFLLLSFFCLDALITYSYLEFSKPILDLSHAYEAIEKHGFIGAVFKIFIAGTAICIAWQRSLVADYQNKMTRTNIEMTKESNIMSNYFLLQQHCIDLLYKEGGDNNLLSNENLCRVFFNSTFNNPSEGDYTPNCSKFVAFSEIDNSLRLITCENHTDTSEDIQGKLWDIKSTLNNITLSTEGYFGFIDDSSTALFIEQSPIENITRLAEILSIIRQTTLSLPIKKEDKNAFFNKIKDLLSSLNTLSQEISSMEAKIK